MLTYEELRKEECWRDQTEPPNLRKLRQNLETFYIPGKASIGTMGDNRHLRGYHRSRRWIEESKHCTNRTYSVSETQGNRAGGDPNWCSAIDLVIGSPRAMSVAHAVNVAKNNGAVPYIREIIVERAPWHVHLSIDRAFANADHGQLYRVITGTYVWEEPTVNVSLKLPVLRNGSTGPHVHTAQCLLTARGFATKNDGIFGDDTAKQTEAMQRKFGAEKIDRVWGPETWTIAVTGEDRV